MSKFALAIATVASVAAASTAFAGSSFTFDAAQHQSGTVLELGVVNAPSQGVLEVYDYRLGEQGKLLATEKLHAGANDNTRVNLNYEPFGDVLAVVSAGGQVVDTQVIDFD